MKRNLDILKSQQFDVLIIGAGIHGAATARECAAQGWKTALIEKEDFGGATSANSLKIIHGGLRYLQHLNIKRMRESIASRRIFSALSPHNIRVISCLIPNSGYGLQSNLVMKIGLKLNDCIAYDRNKGVDKECWIPPSKILPVSQCKELFPDVDWKGMSGGSVWHEAIAFNSERLTLAFIKEATKNGATAANYLEVNELEIDDDKRITGCGVTDTLKNEKFTIKTKTIVVSGGAWNNKFSETSPDVDHKADRFAKAVNIIIRKPLCRDYAIGLTGEVDYQDQDAVLKKKGRFFFFVPWRNYTMIGTTYKRFDGSPDQLKACKDDVNELLAEVNAIYPSASLEFSDVTNVHVGLVPLSSHDDQAKGDVQLEKETTVMVSRDGSETPKGLVSVKSVKFTTAPVVAQETVAKVGRHLGRNILSISIRNDFSSKSFSLTMDPDPDLAYLQERYGKESADVLPYVQKTARLLAATPNSVSAK